MDEWTLTKIQRYIDNQVEESLMLDYKASGALDKNKKNEITKDVSAMANSAGGIIIYGIKEYQQTDNKHLPEKIDPVDRTIYSKEWLEHVISNIRPRIADIIIHPIPIDTTPNHVVYVVEIKQSIVPHQATDCKYYKRYNFESVAMQDYEINDIRNRRTAVSQLVNFDTTVKGNNRIFLTVSNIGKSSAYDVEFLFSPELAWQNKDEIPTIFKRGIKSFPPGKVYHIYYQRYSGIVNNSEIPSVFDTEISYFHPELGRRVNEVFHIDFMDYMRTWNLESEIRENADAIKEAIIKLSEQVRELNSFVKDIPSIINPTGLNFSITTLRNLKQILKDESFNKINPSYCSLDIFREVLDMDDLNLAYHLEMFFKGCDKDKKLRDIEGMTEDILRKMEQYFDIQKYLK
jgi:hypothetical protein